MKKVILYTFFAAFIAVFGCGKQEQKTEENAGKTETQTQTSADKKTVSKDIDSSGNELGMKVGLPDDFPKDVPQPPNSNCVGSLFNQGDGTTVTFSSKLKVMEIANFYKEELKKSGYAPKPGMDELMNDKGGMYKWNKAGMEVELMMSFNTESNSTDIVISYKTKK